MYTRLFGGNQSDGAYALRQASASKEKTA